MCKILQPKRWHRIQIALVFTTSICVGGCADSVDTGGRAIETSAHAAPGQTSKRHAPDPVDPSMIDDPDKTLGPTRLNIPSWVDKAQDLDLGEHFAALADSDVARVSLRAMGFEQTQDTLVWTREANLLDHQPLMPSVMPQLPQIDAIAVISICRPQIDEQYIYPTLRSLFAALPPTAVINILVGDAKTAYVAPDVLIAKIGARDAARVHIISPPKTVSDFFDKAHVNVGARATWNYARALRGYEGQRSLLLCEDDIDVSANGFAHLGPHLQKDMTGIYILYNQRCAGGSPVWTCPESALGVHGFTVRSNTNFPTTQAIVYASSVTQAMGDYVALRAGREPYDYLVSRFLADYRYTIGFVYPSIVQHTGLSTTGLSDPNRPPFSTCYRAELPGLEQAPEQAPEHVMK